MIEINLVPDIKQELLRAQRVRNYVISGAVIAGIVSVALVIILSLILGGQAVASNVLDGRVNSSFAQLKGTQDLSKVLTIQNQLSNISEMHSVKNIDSRLFPLLDAINPSAPNTISIASAKVDAAAKTITIEGEAANMYDAAEAFKKSIAGTTIEFVQDGKRETIPLVAEANAITSSDVGVSEDAAGKKVLRLTLSFEYPAELFAVSSKDAVIKSPVRSNVTDSYLGVPQSLFGERRE